jgi:DNA-binding CsgD family transcriptional regulator
MRDLERADELAEQALAVAQHAGAEAQRRALHSLAWIRVLRGRPVDDLLERFQDAPQGFSLYESALERPAGVRSMLRGEIAQARAVFARLLALAEARGEARSGSVMHVQLCDIELRVGDVHAATALLQEWDEWSTFEDDGGTRLARCRGLVEALRGNIAEADRWAAIAIAEGEKIENRREQLEGLRTAGLAALAAHDPARAAAALWPVWEHCLREGIDDPGALPVAPDLVEALVDLGRIEDAVAVTDWLHRLAAAQDHPWGRASALRCRALVDLAAGVDVDLRLTELSTAAASYSDLGLRFEAGRALLSLGRAHRRLRHWGAARRALDQAETLFAELGCAGWSADAHAEAARIGGRKAGAAAELTPTEQRVAQLAAAGLSNKEIARSVVVSVNTVERHLSHAYAKLGVQSRTQLAGRLSAQAAEQ